MVVEGRCVLQWVVVANILTNVKLRDVIFVATIPVNNSCCLSNENVINYSLSANFDMNYSQSQYV